MTSYYRVSANRHKMVLGVRLPRRPKRPRKNKKSHHKYDKHDRSSQNEFNTTQGKIQHPIFRLQFKMRDGWGFLYIHVLYHDFDVKCVKLMLSLLLTQPYKALVVMI